MGNMNATEKQAWLDGLKVGDVVYCDYYRGIGSLSYSYKAALPITKITPTQFVTGGVGIKFKRIGGSIIGEYRGDVEPLTDQIKQLLSAEKLERQLRHWFVELHAYKLTTEQLTAMKKAYEGVAK